MSAFNETKPYRLAISHEEMNSKRRNTMEDVHRIHPQLGDLKDYSYFGIYDGHGGRQIVDFLEETLENNIIQELKVSDEASAPERLTRAFLITDMQSRKLNITTSGSTAVSALLHTRYDDNQAPVSKTLTVANVGDSRAVLVSSIHPFNSTATIPTTHNLVATRLSYDHSAEDATEQQRIKDAGGFITRNRVLGILAVSRSFGDHAEPHVSEIDILKCGNCPMLIMACDGVWDVFTDQEAADLLLEQYLIHGPFEKAAELLVTAAIERGSADNVTAIVVFL